MIDFSAFPHQKRPRQLWFWAIVFIVISVISVASGVVIDGSNEDMPITQAVVIGLVSILFVVLIITVFRFVFGVMIPRVIRILQNDTYLRQPIYDDVLLLSRFADDNGFKFKKYSFGTIIAPAKLYPGILKTEQADDIYLLYEVKGKYFDSNFTYCCLGFVERAFYTGTINRGALAYATTDGGQRVDYFTVLSVDHPVDDSQDGIISVTNSPNGYITCRGKVNDQETIRKMFDALGYKG